MKELIKKFENLEGCNLAAKLYCSSKSLNKLFSILEFQGGGESLTTRLFLTIRNGTYGNTSLQAVKQEANALVSEINRLYSNTEYNNAKIFDKLPEWAKEVKSTAGLSSDITAAEGEFIASVSADTSQIVTASASELENALNNNSVIGIANANMLAELAKIVNGTDGYTANSCSGKTIVLTDNIDLSAYQDGERWTPIGNETTMFKGVFNGNGHVLSNLKINRSDNYQGLFGYLSDGEIKNLGVVNADISAGIYTECLACTAMTRVLYSSVTPSPPHY